MSDIQAIRERIEETELLLAAGASLRAVHAEALYKSCRTLLSALTAEKAGAEAAEARVKAAQGEADMIRACCDMFERAINEGDPKAELLIRVQEIREAATRTLKGTPDGR